MNVGSCRPTPKAEWTPTGVLRDAESHMMRTSSCWTDSPHRSWPSSQIHAEAAPSGRSRLAPCGDIDRGLSGQALDVVWVGRPGLASLERDRQRLGDLVAEPIEMLPQPQFPRQSLQLPP